MSKARTKAKNDTESCGIGFSLSLLHPRYWSSWLLLGFMFVLAQLPVSLRHALGRQIGNYNYANNKKRRNIIATNLEIAFPEQTAIQREHLIRQNMQWYACAMLDYSLLFFASKHRLSKMLDIEGKQHIEQAIKNRQSIMILLAHSVMLEFAPAALGSHYTIYGSYKTSKNALMDWMIAKGRCRFAKFVVSRDQGLRKLVKALVPERLMIFLPDEDLGIKNAVFAPFFGKQKATLTTTARIARMGKAVALPVFCWFDTDLKKYRTEVLAPLKNYPGGDPESDAKLLNHALEKLIKQHPEQYMWQMKWFRTRPQNEPDLYQGRR